MAVILVLSLSILMQFTAALYSLFLLRHFGGRLVWLALAAALFLMTIRRSLSLYKTIDVYPLVTQSLETELVALLISALVLIAILAFRPLINKVIRSEEKLQDETQRNHIILESSPDGFCIINPSGIIEEVNPAYCQMLEIHENALIGLNFNNLTSSLSPNRSREVIEKIILESHGRYDLIQSSKSNKPVYMELIGRHVISHGHDFIYLFLRDITERKHAEKALSQFKNTLDQTMDSIFMFCPIRLNFTYVNEAAIRHTGYTRNNLLALSLVDIQPEFSELGFKELISPMINGDHNVLSFETVHKHTDGKKIPVEIFLQYIQVENNEPSFVAIVRDVTERHEAQATLKEEKEKALVTLASIGDGVITTNVAGEIDYMNQVAEKLCGIRLTSAKGKLLADICQLVDEKTKDSIDDPVSLALLKNAPVNLSHNLELQNHDSKTIHSVEVVVSPIFNNEKTTVGSVLTLHDTTELRGMAQQLSYQASHDSLTDLINRREFESRLESVIENVKHNASEHVLFYMDLDNFKIINDTSGHLAGDKMLLEVTNLFSTCMRESDTLARLGGDEFGVLLENCHLEQAQHVATKIHQQLQLFKFSWDKNIFEVGVSIGIVPINNMVTNITELLSAADSACYVAKESGHNSQHIYVTKDKALTQHYGQMKWYQRIKHAFDENDFEIHMQEIKPTSKNNNTHAEILLRMKNGSGGVISPVKFLPTAERYYMAMDIDQWVLRKVFSIINMPESRLALLQGDCAINISGQSLGQEKFLDYVLALFEEYKIDGRLICFEITETAVIGNISQARKFMTEMRNKGCQFSLDDFGSGLSSFSYLKDLDVNYLKIDGNFIKNILTDEDDFNMVTMINNLGHSLGLKTIAEFVETEELVGVLEDMGVDYIQGYAIDMPSPVIPK